MADEALVVPDVLRSFTGGEIDLVYVHSIRVGTRGSASRWNIAVPSSSGFPKLYHVVIELSCFVKPLFPLPTSLPIREGGSSHHDSELLGYSSLEGIHEDAVIINSTLCLGQFESSGVLVKVSIELVHAEGIDGLVSLIFEVLRDEGLFKGFAYLFEGFL